MQRYLEIKQTTNTYNSKLRATNLSRVIFDCEKGKIVIPDITTYAFPLSPTFIRIDENGNEVWGLKCSEETVIKIHEDLEQSFIFSQLCQILPQKLLEEGGLQFLQEKASALIALRDDPEASITMEFIAQIGEGVFVDFEDEDLM